MSLLSLRLQKKKIIGVDVVLRIRCNTEAVKKLSLPDLPHRAGNEKFCCRVENPLGKNLDEEIEENCHSCPNVMWWYCVLLH